MGLAFAMVAFLAATDEVPATRLVYVPGKYAAACPTEVEVAEGVARRIGVTPFAEPPTRIVVVALDGDDAPTRAKVELFDTDFNSLGARSLDSGAGCSDLVEAAELAISIALAPTLALAPPVAPKPVVEPLAIERRDDVPPAAKEPPAESSWLPPGIHLLAGAGVNASVFLGPDNAVGANLSAALRAGSLEIRAERRLHLPGYDGTLHAVHGEDVATIAPCFHYALLSVLDDGDNAGVLACGTASVGDVWGVGFPANAFYIGGSPYAGVGARVGAEWTRRDLSGLRAWAQVELNVIKPQFLVVNGTAPWTQDAPVNITLGLAWEFPWPI